MRSGDDIAFIEQIALYNIHLKQFGVCLLIQKKDYLNPKETQLVLNIHSFLKEVPKNWPKYLR